MYHQPLALYILYYPVIGICLIGHPGICQAFRGGGSKAFFERDYTQIFMLTTCLCFADFVREDNTHALL